MKYKLLIALSIAFISLNIFADEIHPMNLSDSELKSPYFSPNGYVFYQSLAKQSPALAEVTQEALLR
jgi:hypothetical protein